MNLSTYYQEFETIHTIAVLVVCLAFVATLFVGIRSICDKTESTKKKIVNCVLLLVIFCSVSIYYFLGPYLGKQDVEQGTIYCHEGNFEIVETTKGLYHRAEFILDGERVSLKYFPEDGYDFEMIVPGKYEGKLVYAQHLGEVLFVEIAT